MGIYEAHFYVLLHKLDAFPTATFSRLTTGCVILMARMESENCQCLSWQLVSESVADGTRLARRPPSRLAGGSLMGQLKWLSAHNAKEIIKNK